MIFSHSSLLNTFSSISHAFTTKDSGNIAFHVNDNFDDIISRHDKLSYKLGYNKNLLVHMNQIHSDIVHIVTDDDNFENPPTCDALITDKKNTSLMVMVADCSPILFYDDIKKVIAVAHAGRPGAFNNIIKNVIERFKKEYNSDPKDICVSVGANIKKCCYEVGSEIDKEASELNLSYAISTKEDSFYLDIDSIIKTQLLKEGVLEKNIDISKECTKCSSDKYFSYRADAKTGRFSGIIILKP